MSAGFPLVRAADITPFLRWKRDNGRQIDDALELAHLPVAPWEEPDRLIPLLGAFEVMRSLSEREGPDVACRVVSETSISELGALGEMMLAGRTPREALTLLCDAIERHSSHEQFVLVPASGGVKVHEQVALDLDQETRHVVQQYVAALIRSLFRMTGFNGEPFGRVEMSPHPQFGLAHIQPMGASVVASPSGRLSVSMSDDVLDRPFLGQYRSNNSRDRSGEQALLQGMPFRAGVKLFIATMLEEGEGQLSVAQLAVASGLSQRTTQRMLAEEDTSFSALVDEVRRARALEELGRVAVPIGSIAADLGYSGQQAFVRAVRRWTGKSPREFRKTQGVVAER
jgi:AraC-like DNA-binding protein